MAHWSEDDIPDQTGRTALITGATGGLGLRAARVLASKGARVLLAGRNPDKLADALETVTRQATDATPEGITIDLASQASVRDAVPELRARTGDHIDLLLNNAGVMAPPLGYSEDGFELQWATNVLGPYALTWSLLPTLAAGSRVVFVSSLGHFAGRFTADEIPALVHGENYNAWRQYSTTKLADLLLSRELQKQLLRTRSGAISVAAHPGFTATNLVSSSVEGRPEWVREAAKSATAIAGQSVDAGTLPLLYAATAPDVTGSQYFGPAWVFETRGPPTRAARSPLSRSDELGAALVAQLAALDQQG